MGPTASATTSSYSLSNHCVQIYCLGYPGFFVAAGRSHEQQQVLGDISCCGPRWLGWLPGVPSSTSRLSIPPLSMLSLQLTHLARILGLKGYRHIPPCFMICVGWGSCPKTPECGHLWGQCYRGTSHHHAPWSARDSWWTTSCFTCSFPFSASALLQVLWKLGPQCISRWNNV